MAFWLDLSRVNGQLDRIAPVSTVQSPTQAHASPAQSWTPSRVNCLLWMRAWGCKARRVLFRATRHRSSMYTVGSSMPLGSCSTVCRQQSSQLRLNSQAPWKCRNRPAWLWDCPSGKCFRPLNPCEWPGAHGRIRVPGKSGWTSWRSQSR